MTSKQNQRYILKPGEHTQNTRTHDTRTQSVRDHATRTHDARAETAQDRASCTPYTRTRSVRDHATRNPDARRRSARDDVSRMEVLRAHLDETWKPYFLQYMSCCGGGACVPRDPALPISVLETHLR